MIAEYHCQACNETFSEDTVEGVLKRAAAHNHTHHGGPLYPSPSPLDRTRSRMPSSA